MPASPGAGRRKSDSAGSAGERVPPQDIQAEQAALGAMLLEGEAAGLAVEILVADDFYRSAHRHVFDAIREIYDEGQQPDEVLVRERLESKKRIDEVGGADYLHQLTNSVPSAANIENYARIVKNKALARNLVSAATAILRDAEDASEMREVLDKAEQRIYEITSDRSSSEVASLHDILEVEIEQLAKRIENPGLMTGLQTDFAELDQMTGGFQPSDFLILAARPSVGKTALALNFIQHISGKLGHPTLLFSLEMSKQQVATRFLCTRCRISFEKLRGGYLSNGDMDRILEEGMGELAESPIFVDDTAAISVMEMRAKARRMKSKHDIKMIVVDYLQLMTGSKVDSREREVAIISSSLKALARELNVPVLALSQIRRAAEDRKDGKPQLADLRESGSLEQDADMVLILHRERMEDGRCANEGTLTIAKQRNGPTGSFSVYYNHDYMLYRPMKFGAA